MTAGSKLTDAQAAYESSMAIQSVLLAGTNSLARSDASPDRGPHLYSGTPAGRAREFVERLPPVITVRCLMSLTSFRCINKVR